MSLLSSLIVESNPDIVARTRADNTREEETTTLPPSGQRPPPTIAEPRRLHARNGPCLHREPRWYIQTQYGAKHPYCSPYRKLFIAHA